MGKNLTKYLDIALKGTLRWNQLANEMSQFGMANMNAI